MQALKSQRPFSIVCYEGSTPVSCLKTLIYISHLTGKNSKTPKTTYAVGFPPTAPKVGVYFGAADGSRTRTPIRTQAPQACQSTNSSTAANCGHF